MYIIHPEAAIVNKMYRLDRTSWGRPILRSFIALSARLTFGVGAEGGNCSVLAIPKLEERMQLARKPSRRRKSAGWKHE